MTFWILVLRTPLGMNLTGVLSVQNASGNQIVVSSVVILLIFVSSTRIPIIISVEIALDIKEVECAK